MFSKDYVEEEARGEPDKQWPHSACIIDVTRCSVAFANAEDLMEGFERVMDGACQEESGCRPDLKSSFALSLSLSFQSIPIRVTSHKGNVRPAQGCEIQEQVPRGLAGHLQEHQFVN